MHSYTFYNFIDMDKFELIPWVVAIFCPTLQDYDDILWKKKLAIFI